MNSRQLVSDFYKAKPLDAVAWVEARNQDLLRGESVRILEDLYFEAGWLGWCTARHLIGEARGRRKAPDVAARVDWGGWVPGDADAARKLLGDKDIPGLKDLLEKRSVTIKGIEDTRYKDLAGILARGVESGSAMETVAGEIVDYLKVDADWADTVARTETRSAVTQASLDSYRDASISQKEWLTAWDEACEICSDAQAMGPIPIDEDFGEAGDGPPGHPNCLCVVLPVIGASEEPEPVEPEPPIDTTSPFLPSDVVLGTKTAEAAGSNRAGASGFWTGTDGIERYVKEYSNPEQAWGELLANRLYAMTGAESPLTALSTYTNSAGEVRTLLVTEIVPNQGTVGTLGLTQEIAQRVVSRFATDLWLANYDAVGTGLDNLVVTGSGVARIDAGGSLFYRAMGGLKDKATLGEVRAEPFFQQNPYYKQVLNEAGYKSVADMKGVLPDQIRALRAFVDSAGGSRALIDDLFDQVESNGSLPFVIDANSYAKLLDDRLKSLEAKYSGVKPAPAPAGQVGQLATDIGEVRARSEDAPPMVHDAGAKSWKRSGSTWGNSKFAKWQAEVAANVDESRAVGSYTGSGYGPMNTGLRDGLRAGDTFIPSETQQVIKALSKGSIPEDIIVNRGISYMSTDRLKEMLDLKVGDILHDYGFMSTSVGQAPKGFQGPVWMRIRVPQGSQAGYLGKLSVFQNRENELLLQAGSSLRVDAIHKWGNTYIMDATLVRQSPGQIVNAEYFAGKMVIM